MGHELTREKLYDLVWAEPISRLSPKFGVSDVAIAKACRRANIPVPGRGYWAKLQYGKKVAPIPLPPLKPEIPAIVRFTPPAKSRVAQFPPGVREQVNKETATKQRIVVPSTLANAHPIIRGWLKGTRGRPSEIEPAPAYPEYSLQGA